MTTQKKRLTDGKKLLRVLLIIFLVAIVAVIAFFLFRQYLPMKEITYTGNGYEARQFSTKEEVNSFLDSLRALDSARSSNLLGDLTILGPQKSAPSLELDTTNIAQNESHSTTNVQVEGIDESDIVKTNGKYIYRLGYGGLVILEVQADGLVVKKEIKLTTNRYSVGEMMLYGNKLIISCDSYMYVDENGKPTEAPTADDYANQSYAGYYKNTVDTRIYNVEDPANPVLEKQMIFTGNRVDMRLKGSKLYFIINHYSYYYYRYASSGYDTLPQMYIGNGENVKLEEMPLDKIYYFDGIPYYHYSVVGMIDLETNEVSSVSYFGSGETVYMSHNYLYLAATDSGKAVSHNGLRQEVIYNKNYSRILRIKLDDLQLAGIGKVEGYILNKYSMDEYNGFLRLATTTSGYGENGFEQYNNIFILDENLIEVGKITNIAPGERIYSARFDKEEGAIVTFRQVDPLYKVNLSDPHNPTISDGLKKDGVAYYLHKINDKYTVGVGMNTDSNGTSNGIEVVLYNMEGADAVISHKLVIGERWASAEALYNPHAFLVDLENNIFGFDISFPVEVQQQDGVTTYYTYKDVRDFLVFSFYENEEGVGQIKVEAKIRIGGDDYTSNFYYYSPVRGLRIGTKLYVVEDLQTKVYDITNDYGYLYKAEYFKELNNSVVGDDPVPQGA
ncbi:MAG TPA: beta-propeller domain-containing protein [Clostridia bacterium]|jgi:uncharacterized secreted protein with C-terminal beta-propeller domain|nr:beta-propeller domain-containing protein [Clostridia bacterium]